jgi:hypothetical protein
MEGAMATESAKTALKLAGATVMLLAAVSLAHCGSDKEEGGGGGSSDPGASEAKKFFASQVYPQLEANCAKCHATGQRGAVIFLGSGPDPSYAAIEGVSGYIAAPSSSPIAQKGLHSGPALTEKQFELVSKWLDMEVAARGLQASHNKPPNLRAAFKAFGDCMDYNKWVALGLNELPNVQTENNQGQCKSCHNAGTGSMWLFYDPQDPNETSVQTFNKLRRFPYIQRLVVGRVNASGAFDGLEPSRRIINKGREEQQEQANNHPRFSLPVAPINFGVNLDKFVQETLDNMLDKNCKDVSYGDASPDAYK